MQVYALQRMFQHTSQGCENNIKLCQRNGWKYPKATYMNSKKLQTPTNLAHTHTHTHTQHTLQKHKYKHEHQN